MKLRDIPYSCEFYWKGERYTQVIRPRVTKGKFTVVCRLSKTFDGDWVDMPGGREIKPVIRGDSALTIAPSSV